jgi:hypothetical protein
MIVTEYFKTRSDGVELNRTYSDNGIYDEAIDIENAPFTHEETDTMAKIIFK